MSPAYDVIVVGSGPAGGRRRPTRWARRAGVSQVIEEARLPRTKACGDRARDNRAENLSRIGCER